MTNAVPKKHCRPCNAKTPPFSAQEIQERLRPLGDEWKLNDKGHLSKRFSFATYLDGAAWVQSVAALAEEEDHHPLIILDYKAVTLELWTHVIKGLSENDFILAQRITELR